MSIKFRTGFGYDAHRFAENRKLILCGEEIPYERGLSGHSDADAPLHALTDALLGALAIGDIGWLFPDTSDEWKDANSVNMLKTAYALPEFRDWQISNIDIAIIAQKPKILPYVPKMRENIANALNIDKNQVSVKGKTTEGMGFCGRGEGIEAFATVLLEKKGAN